MVSAARTLADNAEPPARRHRSRWRSIPPAVALFMLVVAAIILMALLAPLVAPYAPNAGTLRGRLLAPSWLPGGDPAYFLGSDEQGRDVLSRIIYGARISLTVGFAAVLVGGLLGSVLGLVAGYFGRAVDEIIMTVADIQLAFPFILLAIAVLAVVRPSLTTLIIVVGISGWVTYARIARAQVLGLKEREFVTAVRSSGGNDARILFRHILPNILSPLIVVASLDLARTIILESTLSFLGLGVQPPTASWGSMLGSGREYINAGQWWISTFAGLALTLTTIGVSRIGDWVRDVLDPTMRNV
jgi:peptide/nickel transport system permease protein